jgi:DNA-binding LytR/AlgR family response regulator
MPAKVLIVEDEILVAASLEAILEDLGCTPVGIAPDAETALALASRGPDLAFVDLNLRDGATGVEIGARLAQQHGVGVIFVTANPRQLGDGIPGTLGVMTKPCEEEAIAAALDYGLRCMNGSSAEPPPVVRRFEARPS